MRSRRREPSPFLAPLGWLYMGLSALHHTSYDHGLRKVNQASVPVISVGNLTAGGTGKTPTVAWLCRRLAASGYRVGIVSRGHGGKRSEDPLLVAREGTLLSSSREAGDEPLELARRCPAHAVAVGLERIEAARMAAAEGADLILLDDGFQHRRLARDLNILLLDAEAPFGSGRGLPAGMLREPRAGLRRADLILLTRATAELADSEEFLDLERLPGALTRQLADIPAAARPHVVAARHQPRALRSPSGAEVPLEALERARIVAVSGIARPGAFENTLRSLGARVTAHLARRDHYVYDLRDAAEIVRLCAKHRAKMVITTAKDLERWPEGAPRPHVLEIELQLGAEHPLLAWIAERLRAAGGGVR